MLVSGQFSALNILEPNDEKQSKNSFNNYFNVNWNFRISIACKSISTNWNGKNSLYSFLDNFISLNFNVVDEKK